MERRLSSILLKEAALSSLIPDVSTETTLKPGGKGSSLKVNTSSVVAVVVAVGGVVAAIATVGYFLAKQKNWLWVSSLPSCIKFRLMGNIDSRTNSYGPSVSLFLRSLLHEKAMR